MKLNLGAADRHIDGFICYDINPPNCENCDGIGSPYERTVDLSEAWPWASNSATEVLALDVCEHIGDGYLAAVLPSPPEIELFNGRIHFMNELHRVLIPGGRATIETPNAARGVGYFQDPTHCSPWCLSTFKYFEHGAFAHQRLSKAYGITAAFRVISMIETRSSGENPVEEVFKIRAVLEAVK